MPLYHWDDCEVLKAYGRGNIFAEAESVEEAREEVFKQFEVYLRNRYDWLFYHERLGEEIDEDDAEEIAAKKELLRKDISREPTIIIKGAIFIEGSS
jgi:hypothetical protein